MRFAVYIPNFGPFHSPRIVADSARVAEAAGWDGLFIWDHVIWDEEPVGDPWISLAAAASATRRIRLGPVVTPIPRRRPWQVARAAATLDLLSGGRTILGVGIGSDDHGDFRRFDEPVDRKTRAGVLDEGLAIIEASWSGRPLRFTGEFFDLDDVLMLPAPAQKPRIPIWVSGNWPNRRPIERASRWDGVVPQRADGELSAADVTELRASISDRPGGMSGFDVLHIGHTPDNAADSRGRVRELGTAGVTWWLENLGIGWLDRGTGSRDHAALRDRIAQGPPR